MTCQKDCKDRHTHKRFFCIKCDPEMMARTYPDVDNSKRECCKFCFAGSDYKTHTCKDCKCHTPGPLIEKGEAYTEIPIYPLSKGLKTLVSTADVKLLLQYKWYISQGYIRRKTKENKSIFIHRLVMNAPKNMVVDHINGNTLDNRRENLRVVTSSQNSMNRTKLPKHNTSGFLGVYFHKKQKKWRAVVKVTIDGKQKLVYAKNFNTKEEAHLHREKVAKEIYKEFAPKI